MVAETGLVSLRGKWVEVDREKLTGVLEHWKRVSAGATGEGLSFLEGLRLLSGAKIGIDAAVEETPDTPDWSEVHAGSQLRETLEQLSRPETAAAFDPNRHLTARLRPYQEQGVKWLWFLQNLGFGGVPGRRHGPGQDHPDHRPPGAPEA